MAQTFHRDVLQVTLPGMLAGLALTGGNRLDSRPDEDDGIMWAMEAANLDLGRTDMVVLNACESGLGEFTAGEGMLSVQRSLHIAGARSVIATLWEANIGVNRALMRDFCRRLWQDQLEKSDALRETLIRLIHHYDPIKQRFDPERDASRRLPVFFWAPYVLSGDWHNSQIHTK